MPPLLLTMNQRRYFMEIRIESPEVIGQQDYKPTAIDNVFVNKSKQTVCIVGFDEAMVLSVKDQVK